MPWGGALAFPRQSRLRLASMPLRNGGDDGKKVTSAAVTPWPTDAVGLVRVIVVVDGASDEVGPAHVPPRPTVTSRSVTLSLTTSLTVDYAN